MAKAAKSTKRKAKAPAKKAARSSARLGLKDEMTIKIVGDNTFREGGRLHAGLEALRKYKTVGAFREKFKPSKSESAGTILRIAVTSGFAKIA